MKRFRFSHLYFIPWIFLLCSCGEDEIEFKPGPILSDVIQNRDKDKKKSEELDKRTKHVQGQVEEEVMPIVRREQLALNRQQALEARLDLAGELSDEEMIEDPFQPPLQILPYEMQVSENESIPVILIQGPLINMERLKRSLFLNSSHLAESEETKDSSEQLVFANSPFNPSSHDLPIVFSAKRIELHEDELIETKGRELWFVTEKLVYEGQISTRPDKSDFEQAGRPGGNFYLYAPVLEVGPKAVLNLSGGDAGDFNADVPYATEEQVQELHHTAIEMAFNFNKVQNQEVSTEDDAVQEAIRKEWPSIRKKMLELMDESQFAEPWKDQPEYENGYPIVWKIKAYRNGRVGLPNGRYPIVAIPEIEFKSDINGGLTGEFISEVLRGDISQINLIQKAGETTYLKNMRRPQFKLRDKDKLARHEESEDLLIQVAVEIPEFETKSNVRARGGGERVEWIELSDYSMKSIFGLSAKKMENHSQWFDVTQGEVRSFTSNSSPTSFREVLFSPPIDPIFKLIQFVFDSDSEETLWR